MSTMYSEAGIEHWSDVEASLSTVEWSVVEQQLQQGLLQGPIDIFQESARHQATVLVQTVLRNTLGVWHRSGGPALGDETIRGWCWCHNFIEFFDPNNRDESVLKTTSNVVDELKSVHGWYTHIQRYFESLEPVNESEREAQLIGMLDALVDQVIQYGIHDSWYYCLGPATVWMLEVQGVEVTPAWADQLFDSLYNYFESWSAPKPERRRAFTQDTAWQALLLEFESIYNE